MKLITVVLFHIGNKAIFSLLSLLLQPTAFHTCHTFFEPCQSDPFLLAGDNVCVVTSSIIYVGFYFVSEKVVESCFGPLVPLWIKRLLLFLC